MADGYRAVVGNDKSTKKEKTVHCNRSRIGITAYSVADGAHVGYTSTLDTTKLNVVVVT